MRRSLAVTALLAAGLGVGGGSAAAGQGLDIGFGPGGTVTTSFDTRHGRAFDLVRLADGRLVLVGSSISVPGSLAEPARSDVALARHRPDGSPDPSFGSGGRVEAATGTGRDVARAAVLQPDGRIVVAGYTQTAAGPRLLIVRLELDGSPDPSFGTAGRAVVDVGGESAARDVAIQADGRIVAAGFATAGGRDFALVRLARDGRPDRSFSGDGVLATDFRGKRDEAYGLAIQQDGRIVAAGSATRRRRYFALARYLPDGSLDRSFSRDGRTLNSVGERDPAGRLFRGDVARAVAVRADGRIAAAGLSGSGGFRDFALARYRRNGSLDRSLAGDGTVTTSLGRGAFDDDYATALVLQPDGRIALAGTSSARRGDYAFAFVRYNRNGARDTSFSGEGKRIVRFAGQSSAQSLLLQPDGKPVAAGETDAGERQAFALARLRRPRARNAGPDSDMESLPSSLRSLRRIEGSAGDDSRVRKVDVAIRRLGRRAAGCRWLRDRRGGCAASRRFLRARGRTEWRLTLGKDLPPGRYVAYSRATDRTGLRERRFSDRDLNRMAFRVRR